jgi:hypothetical protein
LAEQRWLTACILARTNHFGHRIQISMRAARPPMPALEASWLERQAYPLFEGGFFGNLFAELPVAYACFGDRDHSMAADPILSRRICTAPDGDDALTGLPVTRCGFLAVGACGQATRFVVDHGIYDEVIYTYLPLTPEP